MVGVIRVKDAQYTGCTVAEVLRRLSVADPECAAITKKSYFVMLSGRQIKATDYENVTVKEEDIIMIVPLVAGG